MAVVGRTGRARRTTLPADHGCPRKGRDWRSVRFRHAAGYQATQKRRPEQIIGSFDCQVCQTEIYAWDGPYAYLDWQAVETMPKRAG
jgi:hypothetical protein